MPAQSFRGNSDKSRQENNCLVPLEDVDLMDIFVIDSSCARMPISVDLSVS